MSNLKETAEKYEAPKIKSVADLDYISIEWEVQEEIDCEFPYKFMMFDGQRYKINNSVIADIKQILIASPNITKFKVVRKGEGMKTKYTVIPLI
jgi:hypothetical protein